MAKLRLVYRCTECGATHPKWGGRCRRASAWNTLVEEVDGPPIRRRRRRRCSPARRRADADRRRRRARRRPAATGIGELDRVLGGGLVPGSVTLLGGEPGIGKSTLLLAAARRPWPGAHAVRQRRGERPAGAAARRAARRRRDPSCGCSPRRRCRTSSPPSTRCSPTLVVIDSIQTIADPELGSAPGQRRAGPRLRPPPRRRGQAARACRSCSSATSPRTAGSPGRGCSSTSSTPCSASRATATTRCACCARSSTASGRPSELGVFEMVERGSRRRARREPAVPRRPAHRRRRLGGHADARGPPAAARRGPGADQPGHVRRAAAAQRAGPRRRPAGAAARRARTAGRACRWPSTRCSPRRSAACDSPSPASTSPCASPSASAMADRAARRRRGDVRRGRPGRRAAPGRARPRRLGRGGADGLRHGRRAGDTPPVDGIELMRVATVAEALAAVGLGRGPRTRRPRPATGRASPELRPRRRTGRSP